MNDCVVAKRSECWIISPVRGETGQVIGSSLKRVYHFDYGGTVPTELKKRFSKEDLAILKKEIDLVRSMKTNSMKQENTEVE